MTPDHIEAACARHGLFVMGALEDAGEGLVLIGANADFWPHFIKSAEYTDGLSDPVDRYSKRVVTSMAQGADVSFPSDGPPYAPFIAWALKTGRFWQSPTGMMVHDQAGLMISIRGAIRLPAPLPAGPVRSSPCLTCPEQPCATACPVSALQAKSAYDVPGCKAYLDTPAGADCITHGCAARRACPISQSFNRPDAQSAFHMRAFNP